MRPVTAPVADPHLSSHRTRTNVRPAVPVRPVVTTSSR